jgi:hypothetical protein
MTVEASPVLAKVVPIATGNIFLGMAASGVGRVRHATYFSRVSTKFRVLIVAAMSGAWV